MGLENMPCAFLVGDGCVDVRVFMGLKEGRRSDGGTDWAFGTLS